MDCLKSYFKRLGLQYSLIRVSNGEETLIKKIIGIPPNHTKMPYDCIVFYPEAPILKGDILINPSGDRYYVTQTETEVIDKHNSRLIASVQRTPETSHVAQYVFNIGAAYGSIIGNPASATINYVQVVDDIKKQLENSETPDKQELCEVIKLLEQITSNQQPVKQGMFSKFSAAMERNSWFTASVTAALLSWLLSQTL